jgi:riboflavin synthase
MFTGLIETTGTLREIHRNERSVRLGIAPSDRNFNVIIGASVAINGVCLTVEAIYGSVVFFTAVYETLQRTTFAHLHQGAEVNLERALPVNGRLDGHFVLGHVDVVGRIAGDTIVGDSILRSIRMPETIRMFVAEKGSVALDGISLTVARCDDDVFEVALIPQTLMSTTMKHKKTGDEINIECDVLARYLWRMRDFPQNKGKADILLDTLERAGF